MGRSIFGDLCNVVILVFYHDAIHLATLFFYQDAIGPDNRYNHPQLLVKLEGLCMCSFCFAVYGSCVLYNMEARKFKEPHIWQRRKPARQDFVWRWSMEAMPQGHSPCLLASFSSYFILFSFGIINCQNPCQCWPNILLLHSVSISNSILLSSLFMYLIYLWVLSCLLMVFAFLPGGPSLWLQFILGYGSWFSLDAFNLKPIPFMYLFWDFMMFLTFKYIVVGKRLIRNLILMSLHAYVS